MLTSQINPWLKKNELNTEEMLNKDNNTASYRQNQKENLS